MARHFWATGLLAGIILLNLMDAASASHLTVLHSFDTTKSFAQGSEPHAGVVIDPSTGSVLGTTTAGGFDSDPCYGGCGTVFALTPNKKGQQKKLHTIHAFRPLLGDGWEPASSPILDAQGNFFVRRRS